MLEDLGMQATTLDECDPGDLVRILGPGGGNYALVAHVAKAPEERWMIHLTEAGVHAERRDHRFPIWVLRHQGMVRLSVDHDEKVETMPVRMFAMSGVVAVTSTGAFLNSSWPQNGGMVQVGIPSGILERYSENLTGCFFGKWSITFVPKPETERPNVEIFSYEVAPAGR